MVVILVITAEPLTASAQYLLLVPVRLMALRLVPPTASALEIIFSAMAFGDTGSSAWFSTLNPVPLRLSSRSLLEVELISMSRTGDCVRFKRNTQYPYADRSLQNHLVFSGSDSDFIEERLS
jgi:hypothetical protein